MDLVSLAQTVSVTVSFSCNEREVTLESPTMLSPSQQQCGDWTETGISFSSALCLGHGIVTLPKETAGKGSGLGWSLPPPCPLTAPAASLQCPFLLPPTPHHWMQYLVSLTPRGIARSAPASTPRSKSPYVCQ